MMRGGVLVVDDDFDFREILVDVLRDEGFAVTAAADGFEAIERLEMNPPPSLILLDWRMPRCDAVQFRALQRARPALAAIPVVLISADARVEEKMRAIEARAYLTKPIKLDRLFEIVRECCESAG